MWSLELISLVLPLSSSTFLSVTKYCSNSVGKGISGSVSRHTARIIQTITQIRITQKAGFFHFARFRTRPVGSPSPNARGVPAKRRCPVARFRRDAAYSARTSSPSFRMTASSQLISISRPANTNAAQTNGLNQWMVSARNARALKMWSPLLI